MTEPSTALSLRGPAFAAALLALATTLAAPARAGNAVAGEEKSSSCRSCHGANGNSPFEGIPSLAGQPAPYIQSQIQLYKNHYRHLPDMTAAVAHLSDEDIADIAAYFTGQKPSPPPAATDRARFAKGRKLTQGQKCNTCHRPTFAGENRIARLAGQREDYLLKAMNDFKSGTRSGVGEVMPDKFNNASVPDMEAIAYYLSRLP